MPFKNEAAQAVNEMREQDVKVDAIAFAFTRGLASALVDDTRPHMKEQGITAEFVENANDYYDANMIMDAAFKECGLSIFNADGVILEDMAVLFNDAWARAVELARRVG